MGLSVFALGGAGAVGAECCRDLLTNADLERLTIGEIDLVKAHELAASLDDPRVEVVRTDVTDVAATARAVAGHQVLMNLLFWESFDGALEAACLADANYADLLSHPEERHRVMAREAGITAVSGLGASPGAGNVLGQKACTMLEVPLQLEISCTSYRPVAPSKGLLDTLIALLSPDLPSRGYHFLGQFVPTRPLEGSKLVDFGGPVGEVPVYYINHSETFTFPKHFPTLQYVAVRGTYRPALQEDFRILAKYGLLDDLEQETPHGRVNVRRLVRDTIWNKWGEVDDDDSHHLFLHVQSQGLVGDTLKTITCRASHPLDWGSAAIGKMTGIGASIGVMGLARQGRTKIGMVDPEEYFDADQFIADLRERPGVTVEITEESSVSDS